MEKNFSNFSMEDVMRLANTDAGRQLMALLQEDHARAANDAVSSARTGDMEKARQALAVFLSDPRAKALLRQLQEDHHG